MTFVPIQCDNCGAKYKLPESFSGSQAKCQKCGSVIDVAGQRAPDSAPAAPAAAKPAAARPAAARPAAAKPAAARPAVDRSKNERPARPARGRASADDDGDKPTRGKRGRGGDEKKKSSAMPLLLGVGGLAVVAVVVILMMQKQDPSEENTAAKNPANTSKVEKPAAKPAEQPATEQPAEKPAEQPAEQPTEKPAEQPAEQPAQKPAEKPAEKPAGQPAEASAPIETGDPSAPKRPWQKMRHPPQSMDQVTDPKTYPEVVWPAAIDDATKAKLRGLLDDVVGGGVVGIRAKPQLVERELRYAALFAIVEKLRTLNYRDNYESGTAFELNKVLEEITVNLNAGFEPVEATEDIHPAKAEWNTRTVKAWMDLIAKYPTEDSFQEMRAERVKKQAEDSK